MTLILLLLISALLAKHYVMDFVFLSPYMLENQTRFGHPGGLIHVSLHVLFTGFIIYAFGNYYNVFNMDFVPLILAAEFVIHYSIDWVNLHERLGWSKMNKRAYWQCFGFDQFLHNMTYVGIIYFLTI